MDLQATDASGRWDRLIEASDKLATPGVELATYTDTHAGFSTAAVHVALLRTARIPYSVQPRNDARCTYAIVVPRDRLRQAHALMQRFGLSADTHVLEQPNVDEEDWRKFSSLTNREREVLILIAEGESTKGIAAQLGISFKTAEAHRTHLIEKVGRTGIAGLVRYAIRVGLIQP